MRSRSAFCHPATPQEDLPRDRWGRGWVPLLDIPPCSGGKVKLCDLDSAHGCVFTFPVSVTYLYCPFETATRQEGLAEQPRPRNE